MPDLEALISQLAGNAQAIHSLLESISTEQARWSPDAETWSMQEVMQHVYNEERLDFRKHLKEVFAVPLQPWGEYTHQDEISVESCRQALDGFLVERKASLDWLRSLEKPNWELTTSVPWGGTISAGDVLVSWLDHDFLHLRQMIELQHAWTEKQAAPYSVRYAGGW